MPDGALALPGMSAGTVLVGAGVAHWQVLRHWAPRPPGGGIVCVTPHSRAFHVRMLAAYVSGQLGLQHGTVDLEPALQACGVQWLQGQVVHLDAQARRLRLADGRELGYERLSIDTPGTVPREALPGAREHALWAHPAEHFVHWAQQMVDIARERALDVVVLGHSALAVELALAVAHRLRGGGEGTQRSRVTLVAGRAGVVPALGGGLRRRALAALRDAHVAVLEKDATSVQAEQVVLADGPRVACDAPIVCLQPEMPAWLRHSGLALTPDGHSLHTTATLQSRSHPEVFSAADWASGTPLREARGDAPALAAAAVLAHNLAAHAAGTSLKRHMRWPGAGRGPAMLETGDGRAAWSWGPLGGRGRLALRWKRHRDKAALPDPG